MRRLRRVKSKIFFFAVLCGGIPGKSKKNKPKTPDVLDAGSNGASISACRDGRGSPEAMWSAAGFHNFGFKDFPIADTQISELGGCCRPTTDPQVSNISSGFRHFADFDFNAGHQSIYAPRNQRTVHIKNCYHDICAEVHWRMIR